MTKTEKQTFGLASAAFILGFADPDDLLLEIITKKLSRYCIPNEGNLRLTRFTMRQIEIIEKVLNTRGLSAEKLGSPTPAGRPHYKGLSDESRETV